MKFKWKLIYQSFEGRKKIFTYQAKIAGGLLINNQTSIMCHDGKMESISESLVFVPDPNHEWSIEK
jgi:hypothetical protein